MRPYDTYEKFGGSLAAHVRNFGDDLEARMFGRPRHNKEGFLKGWYLQPDSRSRTERLRARQRKQRAQHYRSQR